MNTNNESMQMPLNPVVLEQQLSEMRLSIAKIADAMTKMAVLEERHQTTREKVEKVEERLLVSEGKIASIETKQVTHFAKLDGVAATMRVMWTVIGATLAAGFALVKVALPLLMAH